MKKIILSSIAVAIAVTIIACGLFGSDKKESAFEIHGKWQIDSVVNQGSDSSNNIGLLLLSLAGKDSIGLGMQFNNDSTFSYIGANDSASGTFYLSPDSKSLFVNQDSAVTRFDFITKSDTAFVASTPDSVVYYFKRK